MKLKGAGNKNEWKMVGDGPGRRWPRSELPPSGTSPSAKREGQKIFSEECNSSFFVRAKFGGREDRFEETGKEG